jgi:hypothetical protein
MQMPAIRVVRFAVTSAIVGLCLAATTARADYIYLKDGNMIEIKEAHLVIKQGSRGKDTQFVEGTDEKGETRSFELTELRDPKDGPAFEKGKTTWEIKADNQKWYEALALKVENTWEKQLDFGRKCKQKNMVDESLYHFKKSYELRSALPLNAETEEQRHRTMASFLEKDCGLFDEAVNEYAKVYELTKDSAKDVEAHRKLAIWCAEHDLPDGADTQYKAAIELSGDKKAPLVKEYEKFQRSQIVPLNRQLYQQLQPNIEAACKYLEKNEFINSDGSMGKDATEAGVQTIRGMTAMSAEAILCEWDLKFFKDPESAGKPPKLVVDAIKYLCSDKDHNRRMTGEFAGDDLWGPAWTLQFFIRAYSRPYLAEMRPEIMKGIDTAIADLKKLQRSDGGWNYYNFIQNSCSFLSSVILVNLECAKNLGIKVDTGMIAQAKAYIESAKFGEGVYKYSVEKFEEKGTNRSFSAVGACSRSPLCELAVMSAGGGSQQSLKQALLNFFLGHEWLLKLRGSAHTHTGKGRTAPYYYMFSHFWTSRCINRLPRNERGNWPTVMANFIAMSQDPDGTFHDFTGTKAYRLYATALGVLAMHELICAESDVAFNAPKLAKFETTFAAKPPEVSPGEKDKNETKKPEIIKTDVPAPKKDVPAPKK